MHGVTYAALLVVGCASAACASSATLAPQITNAMDQQHLPKVLACWEHEFEAAGFKGRYEARVDFSVASSTGTISGARVRDLEPTDEIDAANGVEHGARLARCVEQALNQSSLAPGGFTPAIDTRVVGLPIVFADASAAVREAASERVKHVLIGPRADRCSGLYTYEPPRPAAVIQGALDDASRQTTRHANSDKDAYARALRATHSILAMRIF